MVQNSISDDSGVIPGVMSWENITPCSSFLKCPGIVSIHLKTETVTWWRRHFSLMNSRREELRALFITFYLINREKKAFDREHYSSKGLHFEFHLFSEVHLFLCRVLLFICFIYIPVVRCYHILSSIVKKNDSSFFALVQGVFVLVHGVFVLVHGVLGLRFWIFVLETPDLLELRW